MAEQYLTEDLESILHEVFGKQSFRPLQEDIIRVSIDRHDVYLQAATSFGKSLCFQFPAVLGDGVTLVISPLLALMADQVAALQEKGIPAATINSTTQFPERRAILDDLLSGSPDICLLYVTPELCQTDNFRQTLLTIHEQGKLDRIAIDEAHCISEWGHDFRPAYKDLSWFREALANPPPITAVTATATPRIRLDIINSLGLNWSSVKMFGSSSARPNIHYQLRYLTDYAPDFTKPSPFQVRDLLSWLKSVRNWRELQSSSDTSSNMNETGPNNAKYPPLAGIIYCPLRAVCDNLASSLSASDDNIVALPYHAGLSPEERSRVQNMWTSKQSIGDGQSRPSFFIIVATNAFGMGIDSPHVRFVVHWAPPRSFEGFVQESGRAGRDGRAAVSVVYYNLKERDRVRERVQWGSEGVKTKESNRRTSAENSKAKARSRQARLESFDRVIKYCENTTRCRHEIIRELCGDFDLVQKESSQNRQKRRKIDRESDDIEPSPGKPAPGTEESRSRPDCWKREEMAASPDDIQPSPPHDSACDYPENPDLKTEETQTSRRKRKIDQNLDDIEPSPRHGSSCNRRENPALGTGSSSLKGGIKRKREDDNIPCKSPCNFACDVCKEGEAAVTSRMADLRAARTYFQRDYGDDSGLFGLIAAMYHQPSYSMGAFCSYCP